MCGRETVDSIHCHRHSFHKNFLQRDVQSSFKFSPLSEDLVFLNSQDTICGAPGKDFDAELYGCHWQWHCDGHTPLYLGKQVRWAATTVLIPVVSQWIKKIRLCIFSLFILQK